MHIADSKCEPASNYREVDNHLLWKAMGEGGGRGEGKEVGDILPPTVYSRKFYPSNLCTTTVYQTMRRFNRDILL